jgi:hypothetical protein
MRRLRLKRERNRLRALVAAALSTEPDSVMTKEQIAFRVQIKVTQDAVFGSREDLREWLDTAVGALKFYAVGPDGHRARVALEFIGAREE